MRLAVDRRYQVHELLPGEAPPPDVLIEVEGPSPAAVLAKIGELQRQPQGRQVRCLH